MQNQKIWMEIEEAIRTCRAAVLDYVEQCVSDPSEWSRLRTRLLGALGSKGLERRIKLILGIDHDGKGNL